MVTTTDATDEVTEHRIAFVKLPGTVDCANVRMVMDSLASALIERPTVLIADGTGMEYCDCAGISALVCAHRWATAIGTRLRVVAASRPVQRVIELTTADEVLDVYLTMDRALADMTGHGIAFPPTLPPLTDETEEPDGEREQPYR